MSSAQTPQLKIGLIRETKTPQDVRVPLTPAQCRAILDSKQHNSCKIDIKIQSSQTRCYRDAEYEDQRVEVQRQVGADCDYLLGVKEVNVEELVEAKTHFMFSHTIKKQPYNRDLLRAVLEKRIRLIDYECLVNALGVRVISFSRWAGIVGTHNGLYTWGQRTGLFDLPRMHKCQDFQLVKSHSYRDLQLGAPKIALTGDGRVSSGSCEVLDALRVRRVSVDSFLERDDFGGEAVYCQLPADQLYARDDGQPFNSEFFLNPKGYHSIFARFLTRADIVINGIYWDKRSPPLFTLEELRRLKSRCRVQVIADITCDIAPNASIPCTLRPTTIADSVFGFDAATGEETQAFLNHAIDVMAVDNLPNELPRDASEDFGIMFSKYVLPELVKEATATAAAASSSNDNVQGERPTAGAPSPSPMLEAATIARDGKLTPQFSYLQNYVDGLE